MIVQEAKRLGLRILLPDVNRSVALHETTGDGTIQLGFLHVKGLTERSEESLLAARRQGGPFTTFDDFLERSGITPENMKQIFSHGFTTKENGSGFGLHSCANIMKELGGTIDAQSDGPGRGATFAVEMPAEPCPKHPQERQKA